MPKIVINEYDKTKAGTSAYANFSVVVPGFLGTPDVGVSTEEVEARFDENGVYECGSQSDFVTYIGKHNYKTTTTENVSSGRAPVVSIEIKLDKQLTASAASNYNVSSSFSYTDSGASGVCVCYADDTIVNKYGIICSTESGFATVVTAWHDGVNLRTTTGIDPIKRFLVIPSSLTVLVEQVKEILGVTSNLLPNEVTDALTLTEAIDTTISARVSELNEAKDNTDSDYIYPVVAVFKNQGTELFASSTLTVDFGAVQETGSETSFTKAKTVSLDAEGYALLDTLYAKEDIESSNLAVRISSFGYDYSKIYRLTNSGYIAINAETLDNALASDSLVVSAKNYNTYTAEQNTDNRPVGQLVDTNYIYYPASLSEDQTAVIIQVAQEASLNNDGMTLYLNNIKKCSNDSYYVIQTDSSHQGQNGQTLELEVIHYGNQIAYELLGMGYTVLFKKLEIQSLEDLVLDALLKNNSLKQEDITAAKAQGNWDSFMASNYNTFIGQSSLVDRIDEKDGEGNVINTTYKIKPEYSGLAALASTDFWSCLRDKASYDFRYVMTGLLDHNTAANEAIVSLAEAINDNAESGRGDCIALVDIDRDCYSKITTSTQTAAVLAIAKEASSITSLDGKYAAIFAPTVTYAMKEDEAFGKNRTFPGSFHYLACAAKALENYNEWYAIAGFTRGVSNYTVETTGYKFGEIAIQALEPRCITKVGTEQNTTSGTKDINVTRAVNLIVKIKNNYYLWGNRTAYTLNDPNAENGDLIASHFLNIRQLCTTIKKQVYTTCRRFTFDLNSQTLWLNFCSAIRPTLESMKSDQGIKDYKIIQTPSKQKGVLSAKIRIVPIEAVEDFYINLYLEDSISGPDAQVSEAE